MSELVAVVALWSHHGHWAFGGDVAEVTAVEALSSSSRLSWWFCIRIFWLWAISRLVASLTTVPAGFAGASCFAAARRDNGNVSTALWAIPFQMAGFTTGVASLGRLLGSVVLWAIPL